MIDLKKLVEAGVHFGHQTWRWCPRMKPYIWGSKNSIHLINVSKTAVAMEKAAKFLESIVAEGKTVLWVGTKKPAQIAIREVAEKLHAPYVTHRWIGGTLTNFPQVKKSVTKLLHCEDILAKSEQHNYTKKELGVFQKLVERHEKNVGGIRKLSWPIGALVVVDVRKEQTAIKEALAANIPVVALVDTNSDPSHIDYVIPGNDDIPRSISLIVNYLGDAVAKGKATAAERPQEEIVSENSVEKMISEVLAGDDEDRSKRGPRRARTAGAGASASRGPRRPAQRSSRPSDSRPARSEKAPVAAADDSSESSE